jgi:hypothetical protein
MMSPDHAEVVNDFAAFGVTAFTTTRAFGTVSAASNEPASAVMQRWDAVRDMARAAGIERFATAHQVHGSNVIAHDAGWRGWLRAPDADGHFAPGPDTALGVSVADCVPVFIAHASGATALLHSGWRGTEARIVERGIGAFTQRGLAASELRVHLGPAICGACYEVSADVASRLFGRTVPLPTPVDLRALIADHARSLGVREITASARCTKCDNDRFFSHRAGDIGRQLSVIYARA